MTEEKARSDPAEIMKGKLYLSSVLAAENTEVLQELQVTHVITLIKGLQTRYKGVLYANWSIPDHVEADILSVAKKIRNYIIQSSSVSEATVFLVHCEAGISRSASVILYYLMDVEKMTLKQAYEYVKERKPNIGPNIGFFQQLLTFEEMQFGENSITLREYLIDQLYCGASRSSEPPSGPASAFTKERVAEALEACKDEPNNAVSWLYENC